MKRSMLLMLFISATIAGGCATNKIIKSGIGPDGKKVYLGPTPIETTEAFQTYRNSPQGEVDKQNYIFRRLKTPEAQKLSYFHDGSWYTWVEAYRGGNWLIRNYYKKGQDARTFINNHVRYSDAGNLHLVKYPDGKVYEAYYILLNELDLLEQTAKSAGKS